MERKWSRHTREIPACPISVAPLTITRIWTQPRCPSRGEWMKNMWCIYMHSGVLATKKNEILSFAATWKELVDIVLSEISQEQRDEHHMIALICGSSKNWPDVGEWSIEAKKGVYTCGADNGMMYNLYMWNKNKIILKGHLFLKRVNLIMSALLYYNVQDVISSCFKAIFS